MHSIRTHRNLTIQDLKKSVDAHDRSGMYGTMQPTWKDAESELLQNLTSVRLAEYLIGMSTLIPVPQDFWPDDGVKWSVNVMEHRASKRDQGVHAFQVLLAESTPAYSSDGSNGTFAVELSAKQMWTGMMMAGFQKVKNKFRTCHQEKIKRSETQTTDECAAVASVMASMLCGTEGIELAGTPVTPRHYNAVFGKKDEALWVEAMDKEVMKCFDIGTWEIVDTADIPPECSVMSACSSFKVKCDSEGKLLECRARAHANGIQQKTGVVW